MRDILFKAKRLDNGKWVEGLVSYPHVTENGMVKSYYFQGRDEMGFWFQCTVSADTICQYTGLTDKNGNKIWENDIIKEHCNELVGRLIWDVPTATYKLEGFGNDYKIEDAHIEWEVIGNIFDNADLLKGE